MKAYHTLVVGASGGGKTTYLRELHANYDGCSIFLTTKSREVKAERGPPRRIRKSSCKYPEDVQKAREWAYQRNESVQIIVDEADGALPDTESISGPQAGNPLREGLHKDRSQGIKYVVASQDPSDLYYPPLKQCQYFVFVGEPPMWMEGFFRYYRFPDKSKAEIESLSDWEYVTMSRSGEVMYRGKTKAQYA